MDWSNELLDSLQWLAVAFAARELVSFYLRQAPPDAVVVSVGHRSSLAAHHSHALDLAGEGQWRWAALAPD